MNADGSEQTCLTELDGRYPAWSPDGKYIVFQSNRDGDMEIYGMTADGKNQTRLTFSPGEDEFPTWSPDGSKIIFNSSRTGAPKIFIMDADGSNQRMLLDTGHTDGFPHWHK